MSQTIKQKKDIVERKINDLLWDLYHDIQESTGEENCIIDFFIAIDMRSMVSEVCFNDGTRKLVKLDLKIQME